MHTVTKILVVFAAILAVLLAALTMAYSINASRITDDYRSALEKAVNAQTSANQQIAEAKLAHDKKELDLTAVKGQVGDLENQVRTLQADKGQLMAAVRAAEGQRDSIKQQTDLMAAANQTLATLTKSYRDEVTKLRENELTSNRQRIELVDRLNDLESQLEVAQAGTRALQEQLVEAQRSLQAAGGVRVGDTATNTDPVVPNFAVSGKVVQIGKDVTGKDTATINLGSNNRIKANMQLSVYRGEKFIGHINIFKTDLQTSAGTIEYLGRNVPVQAGDEVKSFAAR